MVNSISFNSLYLRYYHKCFLFTKSYVQDQMVAEDIVSESLIKLWEILKNNPDNHFDSLLLTILKNKSLDYLKKQTVHQEVHKNIQDTYLYELNMRISDLEACDPEELLSTEIQEIVSKTLSKLPEQSRRIFEMSRYENKSNKEIAEELVLSIKSIEYHITKTLKLLRHELKDYLPIFFYLFL